MITQLCISGFKSLNKFSIKFNKGLNVLIGPNGSGKTNICQSIGLISAVAENNLADYILFLGGAEAVFSKCKGIKEKNIKVECLGVVTIPGRNKKKEQSNLKYEYSFSISLKDKLMLENERLKIKIQEGENYIQLLEAMSLKDKKGKKTGKIKIKNKQLLGPTSLSMGPKSKNEIQPEYFLYNNILEFVASFLFYGYRVMRDLTDSKVFNIDPYLAKKPSNILETTKMLSSGSFLSNAIHEMHKSNEKKAISKIEQILSKIYPRFEKLIPETFNQSLTRTFSIEDSLGIKCAAQGLSDGTIKLIGLLVGIFTQRSATSVVEEPENYLHPWACQTLIEYLRDYFEKRVCLMTTHSETILNCTKPAEIIIINNINGNTIAERIKEQGGLKKAIKFSGFGCGYHYVAGVIGGVPE